LHQRTPGDYEGPYYPLGPRNRTNDLVIGEPRDKVHSFRGAVVDVNGEPYVGALVDIWHTDPLGRYKHPRDTTRGERWGDFLYWGESRTDDNGEFAFRTYVPGAYGRRPAHIHYKIWRNKQRLLTSQVYFSETGGARGASRSPSKADLQTVSLDADGDGVKSYFQVVI
jgi:protocatechuate 3,4-dioxygenase beta subunit